MIPIEPVAAPVAVPVAAPPEPEQPKENIKTIELIPCPKCNKKVTAKTLKYSHERVCPATKQTEEHVEPARVEKPAPRAKAVAQQPPPPEPPVHERIRRMNNQKENYKNLLAHAF